jgi:hypothetical protein
MPTDVALQVGAADARGLGGLLVAGRHDLVHDAGAGGGEAGDGSRGRACAAQDLARIARWCDGGDVDVEATEADDVAAGRKWPVGEAASVVADAVEGAESLDQA